MRKRQLLSTGMALVAVLAASAAVGGVSSQNFESPQLPAGSIQYGADEYADYDITATGPATVAGIVFKGYSGIINNGLNLVTTYGVFHNTPDGQQAAFIQSYPVSGGEIDWTVSGLTAGKTYALSFLDAANLVVDQEALTLSAAGGPTETVATNTSHWRTHVYTFTPTSPTDTISFVGAYTGGNNVIGLDNFQLSAVEEPAAWAMMLVGFGGMGALLRTRRRSERQSGEL